jgi:CHAD domain-containing protein
VNEPARAKVAVRLAHRQRADAAAVAVLRALLEVISVDLPGAIEGTDPECLHQLRVAVRRSRTVQRQLRGVFPGLMVPGFRSEFRWLQTATGPTRDLDVQLAGFDELRDLLPEADRNALEPVRMVLQHARLAAQAEMVRALRSARASYLLRDWEMLLETLVELPTDERPDAMRPIGELAGRRIMRIYERLVGLGRRTGPDSPAADVHELRKRAKELRYMLDMFGPGLFAADQVKALLAALKAGQEHLGRHHDRILQIELLRSLHDELGALPRGTPALQATARLAERLREDAQDAQNEFAAGFERLASPEQRERVTGAFH